MPDTFKDTLTFDDAMRLSGPVAFNVMIKPAGSLCNLDCHYCYYLDKADLYGGKEPKMTGQMLETCVREFIAANDVPSVTFNWHGGEPLVMGMDFYRKALEYQRKYADGKTILNTIQTNGTLVDDAWASFFADNGFLVGISLDGPESLHDRFRKDKGGSPTFGKVMKAVECFHRHGVSFNTMTTVNKASVGRGVEVYTFLKSIGSHYMQFMPVVEHVRYPLNSAGKPIKSARPYIVDPSDEGAAIATWSVPSMAFGKFMCDIFDVWVCNDVGRYFVNLFDSALACRCGVMPGTCAYAVTCGGNSVIEHNGDVYCCDHFVYPQYRLGNIATTPLREMMESAGQVKFGIGKRNNLPYKCRKCRFLYACNGECPKHRFNRTESGETGLNALCDGYYMFYSHIEPYIDKMKELLLEQKAPMGVMPWARLKMNR